MKKLTKSVLMFLALSVVLVSCGSEETSEKEEKIEPLTERSKVEFPEDLEKLKAEKKEFKLKAQKTLAETISSTDLFVVGLINEGIDKFKEISSIQKDCYKMGVKNKDDSLLQLSSDLKQSLQELQRVGYPKLRKQFGKNCNIAIRKDNVTVSTKGKGHNILVFVGRRFLREHLILENKKEHQEFMDDLNFSRVEYYLSKGSTDYQFFDLSGLEDDEIKY